MDTSISAAAPDANISAPPDTGTADIGNGNGQATGNANGQSATGSESFVPRNVDLNTLPPQVRAYVDEVNKQMVRGFTEKTTKLSETVKSETAKAVEAYRQKAEFYDQIAQQEEFVRMWNDHVQKASNPSPNTYPTQQKLQQMEQKQAEIEMKVRTAETLEVINAFAEAKNEKGEKLHPDFDKLSAFKIGTHQKSGEYDLLRAAIELAPGNSPHQKMENGYKAAKATYDAIFEEGKKAGMGRVQQRAQNGSFAPTGTTNATGTAPRRAKDALEALQFAKQGLMPAQ